MRFANPDTRKWWAMLGIGMGVFMSTLDGGIINIVMPALVKALDTDFATVQWVALAYLLMVTATMLGAARLGDMYGKKKLYIIGLLIFTVGSLLCGLAPNVGLLIAFRALQGLGAVMLSALGVAIITEVFPSSQRGRALGIIGSVVSVGIALGPTVGGVLIGWLNWHAVFLVNVPVGIAAAFVVSRVVPPSEVTESNARFDWPGAFVLLLTLVGYALGMTLGQDAGFGDARVLALLAGAAVGLVIFILIESKHPTPMVDLSLFKNILFSINLLMGLLVFIVLGGLFILTFYLELVKGYPTEQIGLLLAAVPVAMGIVSPISGSLADRFGPRLVSLVGLVIIAAACLLISTLHRDVTPLGYVLRLAPLGVGIGMFQSPNNSAVMGAAPRERLGVASGLLALSRSLGQSTGLPLMGALFTVVALSTVDLPIGTEVTEAPAEALVAGVAGVYQIAALVIFAATLLAAAALWLDRQQAVSPALSPAGED